MKTLIQKELVCERGRPLRRYSLTDEGWDVARRVKETHESRVEDGENEEDSPEVQVARQSVPRSTSQPPAAPAIGLQDAPASTQYQNVVAEGAASTEDSLTPHFVPIKLPPGSFSVQLLLDVREVRAKTDRDYMQEELTKLGVKPVMRSLELGDAQWVAKCHDSSLLSRHGAEGDEVVLDWIVERKRLDDLIGSIKDGRFHEQKFRLNRSGVKKVIYIIEDIAMDPASFQRYEESVLSAIASTQVVSRYFVKKTAKMDETIKYLAKMTTMLKRTYEKTALNVIPTNILTTKNYIPLLQHLRQQDPAMSHYISYPAFASMASKSESITLRDIFLKMLMTTKGVTGEKALEIQKKWKTPHNLVSAFEACGNGETGKKRKQDMVFRELGHLFGRKKITKPLSQKIAEVWADV
jgi:crossover junction endonuclease MUS81